MRYGAVLVFLLVVLLLVSSISFPGFGSDEVLWSRPGPYVSENNLELRDFKIQGPSFLQVGDILHVSFNLTNTGKTSVETTSMGVFVAARDPDGEDRPTGLCHQNSTLTPKQRVVCNTSLVVDKNGSWSIWPSYEIWVQIAGKWHKKEGPVYWQAYNSTVNPGEVDLEVYNIKYLPEVPTVGHTVSLKPSMKNIGTEDSPSCEGAFYINDELWRTVSVPPMHAGHSYQGEPESWTPDAMGSYTVSFLVDSGGDINESNEENNAFNIIINVTGEDSTPPNVTIARSSLQVTERDTVTFYANASDLHGLSYIDISGHTEPSYQYFGYLCNNTNSCTHTFGPFPRKDRVYYYAEARDKAGLLSRTPTYNFTVESYYKTNLTVNISFSPEHPTEFDTVNITATASYPYGIKKLRIISYGRMSTDPAIPPSNYTMVEEENVTTLTRTVGPFAAGSVIGKYWAQAEDVDGHVANTSMRSIIVSEASLFNLRNVSAYDQKTVFLVSDLDWRVVLSLVPMAVWRNTDGSLSQYPALIYHQERNNTFDADSTLEFLRQYSTYLNPSLPTMRLMILGNPPQELLRLLTAPYPVGIGLNEHMVKVWKGRLPTVGNCTIRLGLSPLESGSFGRIAKVKWGTSLRLTPTGSSGIVPMDDLFTNDEERQLRADYWSSLNVYVVSQDEYATGLMASVFASHINAPLLLQGQYDLAELDHKYVYLVGDFTDDEIHTLETGNARILYCYTLDELQREYVLMTRTNKVILVNPMDLWTSFQQSYATDKASTVSYLFGKFSLAAPFLAAAKQEVIISTPSRSYPEIDLFVKQKMAALPLYGDPKYLTIVSSPEDIPLARPNMANPVALYGDRVCYEGSRYGDVDIVSNTLRGDDEEYITSNTRVQSNPACSGDIIAWADDESYGDIWYRDLHTETDYRLTGLTGSSTSQVRPAVYGKKIVWQDCRDFFTTPEGATIFQWEIYSHNAATHVTTRVTNNNSDQERPAIWDNTIVYQDNRNGKWDIYKYDTKSGTEEQITSDPNNQERPSISGNKIAYCDDRNGNWDIYLSWLGAGGHGVGGERQITTDANMQWRPCIYGDTIVWQDNRHGNWDIYLYNITTGIERQLTAEPIDQVLPSIWGDIVAWRERSEEGWWYICIDRLSTGISRRIARTEVSADEGASWLEVDGRYYGSTQNLAHQDIATGRLSGVTAADVSSYIARDLFFDRIKKTRNALVVVREDHQPELDPFPDGYKNKSYLEPYARTTYWTADVENQFTGVWFYAGHEEVQWNRNLIYRLYDDSDLVVFVDHGWQSGFEDAMDADYLKNNKITLQPVTILDLACLTGAYYAEKNIVGGRPPMVLAFQNMRRGAMVHMGATDVSYWHTMFDDILTGVYLDRKTIGQAYMEARNEEYDEGIWNLCLTLKGDVFYALHSDPTFQPRWW